MKKYRIGFDLLAAVLIAFMTAFSASANSSWKWISDTRPYDLLPIVIAATLVIEIAAVLLSLKNRKLFWKVLLIVTLANLLSFAAPYLIMYGDYRQMGWSSFSEYYDKLPNYTVCSAYYLVTVLIEFPVVWLTLRKDAKNQWWFAAVIVAANAVTTGLTYLVERHFCYGSW